MNDRYDTSGSAQGQYEPGSNNLVLKNKLGITDPAEMDDLELDLLDQLYANIFDNVLIDQVISVDDLFQWHRK